MLQTRHPLWLIALLALAFDSTAGEVTLGPLFHQFGLALDSGTRAEAAGPLFYYERRDSAKIWAVPPAVSYTVDEETDFAEFDLLYPVVTLNRFGPEYRFQMFQLLAFAGGQSLTETNVNRFTLFPIYFHQWSDIPEKNYWALVPIYGHLRDRLFRDEIRFVLWPLYSRTRKGGVITDNFPYPFLHSRRGPGLRGWQFWPLIGREHKELTRKTNLWDEVQVAGGHDRLFVLWPFYLKQTSGIGTTNVIKQEALLPAYSQYRSPRRDSTTFLWPVGITHTVDREKKYNEWGAPWPLIVFTRGEGKYTSRIWPFFSEAYTLSAGERAGVRELTSRWYLWPLYKHNAIRSDPLDRQRTRILFYLYSDISEKNTETGAEAWRRDLWPLFTARQDWQGHRSLQLLSILEPILPNNKSIERNYSPLWALWRSQRNGKTGAASQSLLWNLYRRDRGPATVADPQGAKKTSLLFGLFQHHSSSDGSRWRLFYIPFGGKNVQIPDGEVASD